MRSGGISFSLTLAEAVERNFQFRLHSRLSSSQIHFLAIVSILLYFQLPLEIDFFAKKSPPFRNGQDMSVSLGNDMIPVFMFTS